jgi:GNAT superfamily N-acetyltransferase
MDILTREMTIDDATAIAGLTRQLGYPLHADQVRRNTRAVLGDKDHSAFVAFDGETVIAWIGVAMAVQIELPAFCEINGLVVDKQYRGKGIGKLLIEEAKQWAREKGLDTIRLRCNVKRTETHLFYQYLGFEEIKQQKVFEIKI